MRPREPRNVSFASSDGDEPRHSHEVDWKEQRATKCDPDDESERGKRASEKPHGYSRGRGCITVALDGRPAIAYFAP
jgi:hypothetical protein